MKARAITILLPLWMAASAVAQQQKNLGDLGIEDLLKIEVSSASKRAQPLDSAASAITVITQGDIHRSGARNLAEAMRMAPGVQVQELSGHYYAITIRGFDNPNFDTSYGNKLLVLIDGRAIYSPYASTVYWEVEDLLLDDVDRIEVIRGPGGSLYGANAVNGVINIITKSAAQTQGGLAVTSIGSMEKDRLALRYGWKVGKDAAFRVFGKVGTDGTSVDSAGHSAHDGGTLSEIGFRGDINNLGRGSLMMEGSYNRFGIYENQTNPTLTPPFGQPARGKDNIVTSHLLGRWTSDEQGGGQTTAQLYYDLLAYPYSNASSTGTTWDLDVQRRFPVSNGRELIVGGGYRYELNNSTPGSYPYQELIPSNRRDTIYNAFIQCELPTGPKGHLTLGAKLEHNTFTGFEVEPNVRYLYHLSDSQVLWGAVSRAVRTPSQAELNDHVLTAVDPPSEPGGLPTAYVSFGNPSLTSEVLIANEVGYRVKVSNNASLDFAGYYNVYTNLIHQVQGAPYTDIQFGVPVTVVPTYLKGGERGNVYGFELQTYWSLGPQSQLRAGYSYVRQSRFTFGTLIDAPEHQFNLRLSQDLARKLKLDAMLYWYSAVPDLGASAYTKFDLQVSGKLSNDVEISLGAHDLLYPRHATFDGYRNIPRSLDLKLTVHF